MFLEMTAVIPMVGKFTAFMDPERSLPFLKQHATDHNTEQMTGHHIP
jgi:hypothetical protein